MNQLSNDIKWNKIRAIEKELSRLYYDYCSSHGFGEDAHKIAKREVWILANKIYDIASSVYTDYQNIMLAQKAKRYNWSTSSIHWSTTLKKINKVSKYYTTIAFYQEIENAWAEYEYTNS
jgi:hypothetical protein